MKKILINPMHIQAVVIRDKKRIQDFEYLPATIATWRKKAKPEGFYYREPFSKCYTKEQLQNGTWNNTHLIVDDHNNVYYKPEVIIEVTSGKKHSEEFDTIEEAEAFVFKNRQIFEQYIKIEK